MNEQEKWKRKRRRKHFLQQKRANYLSDNDKEPIFLMVLLKFQLEMGLLCTRCVCLHHNIRFQLIFCNLIRALLAMQKFRGILDVVSLAVFQDARKHSWNVHVERKLFDIYLMQNIVAGLHVTSFPWFHTDFSSILSVRLHHNNFSLFFYFWKIYPKLPRK